jgi:hypothetical protein
MRKIAMPDAASISTNYGEAKPFRRRDRRASRVWRRGLRFGSLRSCGHLFALGAVRIGLAEAGSFQIRCGWLKDLAVGLRVL